jgi:hypothetical protein
VFAPLARSIVEAVPVQNVGHVYDAVLASHPQFFQVLGHPMADGGLVQRNLSHVVPLQRDLLVLQTRRHRLQHQNHVNDFRFIDEK